jgi:hypothetical protein
MDFETPIILCGSKDCKYNLEQKSCKLSQVEVNENLACITYEKV